MRQVVVLGVTVVALLSGCGAGRKAAWETSGDAAAKAKTETSADTFESLTAKGDEAWKNRGDKAQLELAIGAWEQASKAKPDDVATLTKLSRGYYFLADGHLRKGGDKDPAYLAAFEKGTAAGERALAAASPAFKQEVTGGISVEEAIKKVGPAGLEPMYWYASNLGKWSRAKGFATTLGNKDRIKAVMSRALELDPTFFHGGPHRYFGAFYAIAPSFAGGDVNKSKEHYEKSMEIAPGYVGTKVLMADTYCTKKQDRAMFDKLIEEVLATPDDVIPDLVPETKNEKEKAAELKSKANDLF